MASQRKPTLAKTILPRHDQSPVLPGRDSKRGHPLLDPRRELGTTTGANPANSQPVTANERSSTTGLDLPSLPVMTKAEMLGSFDAVATDLRLSRDAVEQHLAHYL
jgi:hypothetical protein